MTNQKTKIQPAASKTVRAEDMLLKTLLVVSDISKGGFDTEEGFVAVYPPHRFPAFLITIQACSRV